MSFDKHQDKKKIVEDMLKVFHSDKPLNVEPFSTKIEKIDHSESILKTIDYFNNLLLKNKKEDYLSSETIEAMNQAIIDLTVALVKFSTTPQFWVRTND